MAMTSSALSSSSLARMRSVIASELGSVEGATGAAVSGFSGLAFEMQDETSAGH